MRRQRSCHVGLRRDERHRIFSRSASHVGFARALTSSYRTASISGVESRHCLTPKHRDGVTIDVGLPRSASERLGRHGNDVRGLPRRRDLNGTKAESKGLRQDRTDDRYDSAFAVQHWGSRSTMVEHQTIIAVINFHQCGTGELLVVPIRNKPPAGKAKMTLWISECDNALFWSQRLPPNRKRNGAGKRKQEI